MNRETMRLHHAKIKKMSLKEFKADQDDLHSRAYILAEKHYAEAMSIVIQPKQKAAVIAKADEIRQLWDNIQDVTVERTIPKLDVLSDLTDGVLAVPMPNHLDREEVIRKTGTAFRKLAR